MKPWEKVLEIFNECSDINSIGFVGSPLGWAWYNFWWTRGITLSHNPKPELITDRYYYERFLGLKKYCQRMTEPRCYDRKDNFYSLALERKVKSYNINAATRLHRKFESEMNHNKTFIKE
jgi:hypothetical protein